jgi:hypothetical protein
VLRKFFVIAKNKNSPALQRWDKHFRMLGVPSGTAENPFVLPDSIVWRSQNPALKRWAIIENRRMNT